MAYGRYCAHARIREGTRLGDRETDNTEKVDSQEYNQEGSSLLMLFDHSYNCENQ